MLSGSTSVNASRKTLVKLTPCHDLFSKIPLKKVAWIDSEWWDILYFVRKIILFFLRVGDSFEVKKFEIKGDKLTNLESKLT